MTALGSLVLQSPGTLGPNTQAKDDVLDQLFCIRADNCVFDHSGRLAARNGWAKLNSVAATAAPDMDVVHSYINSSGTRGIDRTATLMLKCVISCAKIPVLAQYQLSGKQIYIF